MGKLNKKEESWLLDVAKLIAKELKDTKGFSSFTIPKKANEAHSGGWVKIAGLSSGGTVRLYLDKCAGLNRRALWYGFHSRNKDIIGRMVDAGNAIGLQEIPNGEEYVVVKDSPFPKPFQKPWLEDCNADGYYYGYYTEEPSNINMSVSKKILKDITDFICGVVPSVKQDKIIDYDIKPSEGLQNIEGIANKRIKQSILARRGQAKFRNNLLKQYKGKCCVSGCGTIAVLEAAHIELHKGKDDNSITNGLILRSDIHTLFDVGLLLIHPETFNVKIAPELQSSDDYKCFHDKPLCVHQVVVKKLNQKGLKKRWLSRRWS